MKKINLSIQEIFETVHHYKIMMHLCHVAQRLIKIFVMAFKYLYVHQFSQISSNMSHCLINGTKHLNL